MSRFTTAASLKSAWPAAEVERLAARRAGDPSGAAAEIEKAIAAAESTALSYLLARYRDAQLTTSIPTVAATPAALQRRVNDVAMYDLARSESVIAPNIERAYTDAISWFRAVASNRADLGLSDAPAADRSAPEILANKTKADMVFGNGGLDGW